MVTCAHDGARTLWNRDAGIAFRGDCGNRRICVAARRRKNLETRERFALVDYFRTPDLWTFTARTAEQDARYQARLFLIRRARQRETIDETMRGAGGAEKLAHCFLDNGLARDRGEINKTNVAEFNRGLERVNRALIRQQARELEPGYRRSRHAAMLRRKWGTDHVARGRPGAALRIRVRESGELHGRLHAHAASDFDFIHKQWLNDICVRCGLGFCEFERKDTAALRRAAASSGSRVRASTIAVYLSKYLSMPDDRAWPWPPHCRLVSSARKVLPPRPTKPGWRFDWRSVAMVAVDQLGAIAIDANATFYSVAKDSTRHVIANRSGHSEVATDTASCLISAPERSYSVSSRAPPH